MPKEKTPIWVWRQLMRLAIIVIGILPILSSELVASENRFVIFVSAGAILIVGALGEIWQPRYAKKKKDITQMLRLQVLAHFFLLTLFIQFFDKINGPLYLLYLPVIMEAFLSKNVFLGNTITLAIAAITTLEYISLVLLGEVSGLFSYIEFVVRIFSLFLIRAYGMLMAKEMLTDERNQEEIRLSEEKLKRNTTKLKRLNIKLKELSVLKDEFVSVASHELRGPMTTVKGYLSMILAGDAGEVNPKIKKYLKEAYESSERMIRLINNMLNVSRIESGRLVMNLKDIQIEDAIKDVVKTSLIEAKSHGLKLEYLPPSKSLPKVRVDPDRIREIIANLVGNAINFTASGGVIIKSKQEDGMVVVEIEDSGVGISKESQRQLFRKFSQVDGTHAPLKKGSGLGLYICKMLLNEFNGQIWLKSKVGKGSTFYFSLPAIKPLATKSE